MSGRPNPEQIAQLRTAILRAHQLDGDIEKLQRERGDINRRIHTAETESDRSKQTVLDLMQKMDVAEKGNAGWQNRVLYFLGELVANAPMPSVKTQIEK